MVLEPIYEQDFLDCSYAFRPGRSAHDALEALWRQSTAQSGRGGFWTLISPSFSIPWKSLSYGSFSSNRVRDGVIRRLIGKWLKAGVLEAGCGALSRGRCAPGRQSSRRLLSNVYLHYVLDLWFAEEVKPRLRGRAFMIRFADDVVMGFEYQEDAATSAAGVAQSALPDTG